MGPLMDFLPPKRREQLLATEPESNNSVQKAGLNIRNKAMNFLERKTRKHFQLNNYTTIKRYKRHGCVFMCKRDIPKNHSASSLSVLHVGSFRKTRDV